MTNQDLDQLKKTYHQTQPSKRLIDSGWVHLKAQLEASQSEKPSFREPSFFRFVPAAMIVLLVVFGASFGLIQAAQAALPGEPLYPVKRLSETIVSTVSPGSHIKVEHRASEILDISKKQNQGESLEKTVEEYQKAILETKQETSFSSKQGQEFRQRLEQQEEQFKKVQTSGSSSGPALEKAIEVAKEGRSGPDGGEDQKQEDKSGKGGGEESESEDRSGSNSGSD